MKLFMMNPAKPHNVESLAVVFVVAVCFFIAAYRARAFNQLPFFNGGVHGFMGEYFFSVVTLVSQSVRDLGPFAFFCLRVALGNYAVKVLASIRLRPLRSARLGSLCKSWIGPVSVFVFVYRALLALVRQRSIAFSPVEHPYRLAYIAILAVLGFFAHCSSVLLCCSGRQPEVA